MAFQEFYCNSSGDNLNGGSGTGAATVIYTGGSWNSVTGVFTPASGNPINDGVQVGQYAAIMPDGTTGTTPYIARVTARDATTITTSLIAYSGTSPADGTSNRTCRVGGAWSGPAAAVGFPFSFITSNAYGDEAGTIWPRVNLKGTFNITSGITQSLAGPTIYQGYTSVAGDGGKAIIDGGTSTIVLMTVSGARNTLVDLTFQNNGASGTNAGITNSGAHNTWLRCCVNNVRGTGFNVTTGLSKFIECEAYACNQSNSGPNYGGCYANGANSEYLRCTFHDNTGSNSKGVYVGNYSIFRNCIFDSNGGDGLYSVITFAAYNCDFYNNGSDGIDFTVATALSLMIENCNFAKNTGWGITSGSGLRGGLILNCGFGSGTQVNGSGTITGLNNVPEIGSVTYDADTTPWVDPANGDFRINKTAAIGAGRGSFTQTASSYAGAVSAPVIGACQVADYPAAANVALGSGTYANGAYTPSKRVRRKRGALK